MRESIPESVQKATTECTMIGLSYIRGYTLVCVFSLMELEWTIGLLNYCTLVYLVFGLIINRNSSRSDLFLFQINCMACNYGGIVGIYNNHAIDTSPILEYIILQIIVMYSKTRISIYGWILFMVVFVGIHNGLFAVCQIAFGILYLALYIGVLLNCDDEQSQYDGIAMSAPMWLMVALRSATI